MPKTSSAATRPAGSLARLVRMLVIHTPNLTSSLVSSGAVPGLDDIADTVERDLPAGHPGFDDEWDDQA